MIARDRKPFDGCLIADADRIRRDSVAEEPGSRRAFESPDDKLAVVVGCFDIELAVRTPVLPPFNLDLDRDDILLLLPMGEVVRQRFADQPECNGPRLLPLGASLTCSPPTCRVFGWSAATIAPALERVKRARAVRARAVASAYDQRAIRGGHRTATASAFQARCTVVEWLMSGRRGSLERRNRVIPFP